MDRPPGTLAQDRYAAAVARGQGEPRAIRSLGRAWRRVVWRCCHKLPNTLTLTVARGRAPPGRCLFPRIPRPAR